MIFKIWVMSVLFSLIYRCMWKVPKLIRIFFQWFQQSWCRCFCLFTVLNEFDDSSHSDFSVDGLRLPLSGNFDDFSSVLWCSDTSMTALGHPEASKWVQWSSLDDQKTPNVTLECPRGSKRCPKGFQKRSQNESKTVPGHKYGTQKKRKVKLCWDSSENDFGRAKMRSRSSLSSIAKTRFSLFLWKSCWDCSENTVQRGPKNLS